MSALDTDPMDALASALNAIDPTANASAKTMGEAEMLARVHNVVVGGTVSHLTTPVGQLLAGITNALSNGPAVSHLTHSRTEMVAAMAGQSALTVSEGDLWASAMAAVAGYSGGGGGGGGTPAWVTALAAPSTDLPTDALVFTDGHYWSNGSEQAVTALLGGGGYAGNFDPTAISASGMACLVGNTNRPLAAGDLLTSFTSNYLGTYVFRVVINEMPADTPDVLVGNIIEFFGNDIDTDPLTLDWYTTDSIGSIAWEAANTDYGSFDVVASGPGNASWSVALTLKANGDVVSSWGGGAAQTDAASQPNAGPPTKVSIGFADTSSMVERALRGSILSLVRYDPQPDADLPTLSA